MSAWAWGKRISKWAPKLSEQQVKEIREDDQDGKPLPPGTVTRLCDTILYWQAMWSDSHRGWGQAAQRAHQRGLALEEAGIEVPE